MRPFTSDVRTSPRRARSFWPTGSHAWGRRAIRDDFHALLEAHASITRRVTLTRDGAQTLTASDDPHVAALIVRHVEMTRDHVDSGGAVRMWDPLFRALVAHYQDIELEIEPVEGGLAAVHRGTSAEAIRLAQAHARVVEAFARDGFAEAEREHAAPDY